MLMVVVAMVVRMVVVVIVMGEVMRVCVTNSIIGPLINTMHSLPCH